MTTPSEILIQWQSDSKVDQILIDESSLKIACLHSKYLDFLMDLKSQLRTFKLQKKQWPVTEKRGNPDYEQLELNIDYYADGIDAVEKIIFSINQMSFNIRNVIQWRQFTNGSDFT